MYGASFQPIQQAAKKIDTGAPTSGISISISKAAQLLERVCTTYLEKTRTEAS